MVPENEQLLTLDEAARRLSVSYASLWSWARRGRNGRKLETVVVGSRCMRTSIEACHRFMAYLASLRDQRDEQKAKGASCSP